MINNLVEAKYKLTRWRRDIPENTNVWKNTGWEKSEKKTTTTTRRRNVK